MIIAIAGHVDHGKTSLVRALTGIDTDRLEEEKRRGMSIDLGFAYADLGGQSPVGFVDVPGHERFIRNMLAGVSAIDHALLVVAVDDGPMPQTLEHLAILNLLGVSSATVALTKVDRVTPARVADVKTEVASLLAQTAMRNAPFFPVAATTGEGIAPLLQHLTALQQAMVSRRATGNFRMAIDRCFSLPGAGLVVTGAVLSGSARIDDQVTISPSGISARVRDIHALNQPSDTACAGQRCALNLAGVELKRVSIVRGDWVVAPAAHAPAQRIDARISICGTETRPVRHWTPVHLHIGTAAVNGRLVPLEEREIMPGASGIAQIVLDAPVAVARGDRFILRDQSAQRTIAGGMVLDPFGPTRGKGKPRRLAQLAALELATPVEALAALLDAEPGGVHLDWFARAWNLAPEEAEQLWGAKPLRQFSLPAGTVGIMRRHWDAACDALVAALQSFHCEHRDSLGPTGTELIAQLRQSLPCEVLPAVIKALIEDGRILRKGLNLCLPEHQPRLSGHDEEFLQSVCRVLQEAGLRPPIIGELAAALGVKLASLAEFLEQVSRLGYLVRIAKNRYFLPATVTELAAIASELAQASPGGTFDAAAFRDRSGIGRNLTIEVLEFFDRAGITRFTNGRRSMISAEIADNDKREGRLLS